MIAPSYAEKHYASATGRLLTARIAAFLDETLPRFFGPDLRQHLAQQLVALVESQLPSTAHIRPGQCVWNAVAIDTRADSPRCRLVPVILTLVNEADLARLTAGDSLTDVQSDAIARLMEEAHAQGALLSVRDIGLLTWRRSTSISSLRTQWEAEHQQVLPHPGSLQDMGSCVTHKTQIVVKTVYEHKDPRQVARETKHTLKAVDRYLKDFHRVRTCYQHRPELEFICQATGLTAHLVKQYLTIIEQYEQPPLTGEVA